MQLVTLSEKMSNLFIGDDLLSRGPGHLLRLLARDVGLQEPAFKEVVIAYRQAQRPAVLSGGPRRWLKAQGLGPWAVGAAQPLGNRRAIQIRVYRDIPIPDWKVVLPDKLLQFRYDGRRPFKRFHVRCETVKTALSHFNPLFSITS